MKYLVGLMLAGLFALACDCMDSASAFDLWPRAGPPARHGATPCVLDHCRDGAAPTAPKTPAPDPAADPATDSGAAAAPESPPPRQRYGGTGGASGTPGNFDFYVLSLSWSSGFCETTGDGRGKRQCDLGAGLGFVVHGLWPQYEHGFPSNCEGAGAPSRIALDSARGLFPDDGLARYEWSKHGTCSGKSPQAYFADVRRAYDSVEIPPDFKSVTSQQTLAPIDIARAFIAANSGLRPGAMAVGCQRQTLQEVRICFSKDLRGFKDCPEVARSTCRSPSIRVPPMR